MLEQLIGKVDHVAKWLVWIGGVLLILAAVTVTIDVFARKFFNISMAGSDELSGYAFGISTMLALSYTLLHRGNIRVDAFYHNFPKGVRAVADLLGLALLVSFIAMIAYLGGNMFLDSVHHNSHSITPMRTPLAIPQGAWLFGLIFCVITGVLIFAAALLAVFRRDWSTVQRLAGIKSVDEQIQEETE
jgi:TRAP-type C4-dicarboxylate transport system permease small subunit